MSRVLYVTKHNPWGIGGGATASKMYLDAFLRLFPTEKIDLCFADIISIQSIPETIRTDSRINLIAVEERSLINKLLSPITHIAHRYQDKVVELLRTNEYTHAIFDHSAVAGTLINKIKKNTISIVIHHNYEPDYYKDNTTNILTRSLILPTVRYCEANAYLHCNVNLFLTKEDFSLFQKEYGHNSSLNIVSGLFDTSEKKDIPSINLTSNNPTIVITGSLNNVQNLDGIRYFISDLYPFISNKVRIIIAGRNPGEEIYQLLSDKSNIQLVPNPEDMSEIIKQGSIFVSPARLGGGIKVRVTDGLKYGLPVIAHSVSARGYQPYIDKGYLRVFNSPEEFRQHLEAMLIDIDQKRINSSEIASMFQCENSFEAGLHRLEGIEPYQYHK